MAHRFGDHGAAPGPQPADLDQRRVLVIIGALLLGMLPAALDQTIVATALPTIAGDLHGLSRLDRAREAGIDRLMTGWEPDRNPDLRLLLGQVTTTLVATDRPPQRDSAAVLAARGAG